MAVMLESDKDVVFKFRETGLEALMYEALDYLTEQRSRGKVIKTLRYTEDPEFHYLQIEITYEDQLVR